LFAWGGALDIPLRQLPELHARGRALCGRRLSASQEYRALGAARQSGHGDACKVAEELGSPQLMRRNGHYEIWLHAHAQRRAHAQAQAMQRLDVPTVPAPAELVEAARLAAGAANASGLWFPGFGARA
jgi:hypothetical protein